MKEIKTLKLTDSSRTMVVKKRDIDYCGFKKDFGLKFLFS